MFARNLTSAAWRKSSRSGNGQDCVEVAAPDRMDGVRAVRDSKRPDGPVLKFPRGEWEAFIAGVKDGALAP
ncbi:DUF397 domain-containing protein [Sphaerisporangium sp. NBC_01403]|uniref:DUF397 domain-containing protein n=1 Tax=Sphaerisporangium sp. NBC_01403 TaxID=2903599 RepID=UPI0032489937